MTKDDKKYVSTGEALKLLGWSDRSKIIRWIKAGKFEGKLVKGIDHQGDRWFVEKKSLQKYQKSLNK